MIHSLHTDREPFLRELISNVSDALDRLRFESLTNNELLDGGARLEIRLKVDRAARTLTIIDSGIGMSRAEVISNNGTIARSGTAEFRRLLKKHDSAVHLVELIGRFGTSFYSAFIIADRVALRTRRAGGSEAVEWESTGEGTYFLGECEKADRGTSITLHLKSPDDDNGIPDFTDHWRLSRIVRKHSDFITYPIILKRERQESLGPKEVVIEDSTINSMQPLRKRRAAEVTQGKYLEFYKYISDHPSDPLLTIHFCAEVTAEYDALLFLPSTASHDLYRFGAKHGLCLCAKRVMIMKKCEDPLPHYLRFLRGIVDVADLPLNISRQRLQQDPHTTRMRKRLTNKILDSLTELSEEEPSKYLNMWNAFGRAIKEGICSDCDNKDRLVPLLLFPSSNDQEKLITLEDYLKRAKPEQDQMFYLTRESRSAVENSPHLEAIRDKGYEVLYMADSVDELLLQHLFEHKDKKLKSVGKGTIEFGGQNEGSEFLKLLQDRIQEFKPLMDYLRMTQRDYIRDVRLSTRFATSTACLVVGEHEFSPVPDRALNRGIVGPISKRILELSPKPDLVSKMQARLRANAGDHFLADGAEVLHGVALLAEGSRFDRCCTIQLCDRADPMQSDVNRKGPDAARPSSLGLKPIYLLADSRLLFHKRADGSLFLRDIVANTGASHPSLAYIGASNGDEPNYYRDLVLPAFESVGVGERRMITSQPPPDDRLFLKRADIILLAGGSVEKGWHAFEENGLRVLINERYRAGTLLLGVSAGAVQLGRGGLTDDESAIVATFGLLPLYVGVHEERDTWKTLKRVLSLQEPPAHGIGIPAGGGAMYHDDEVYPIGKPLYEIQIGVTGSRESELYPSHAPENSQN
jgi:molecular chaperone HtpG